MIDFHSHILPRMDDGCKTVEESVEVIKKLSESGIEKIMLTSHYYASRESVDSFLERREAAFGLLMENICEEKNVPELCLGAEVKFFYGISQVDDIKKLCYENTKCLLLELPFEKWNSSVFLEVRNLQGRLGVIPLIAHFNRYMSFGNSFDDILSLGCPLQLNAEVFEKRWGKRKWLKYLKKKDIVLGSDCHNMKNRKPNLDKAIYVISNKLGDDFMYKINNIENMLINT